MSASPAPGLRSSSSSPARSGTSPTGREDAIGEAAGRAFNVVLQGVEECQVVGAIDEGDPRMWAFVAWSGSARSGDDARRRHRRVGRHRRCRRTPPSCCWRVWGTGSSLASSHARRHGAGAGPRLAQDPNCSRRMIQPWATSAGSPHPQPACRHPTRRSIAGTAERPRAGDRHVGVSSQVEAVVQVDPTAASRGLDFECPDRPGRRGRGGPHTNPVASGRKMAVSRRSIGM